MELALPRGERLLTAGELVVVAQLRALPEPALGLFARLSSRVAAVIRADSLDPSDPLDALLRAGLCSRAVPWRWRLPAVTRPELSRACAALGLPRSGRRDALVQRLLDAQLLTHRAAQARVRRALGTAADQLLVRHRGLVARLERWAFLHPAPERSSMVMERLGTRAWPEYTPTGGGRLHRDRGALRAWERALRSLRGEVLADKLHALEAGHGQSLGRLDLTRRLARSAVDDARALERAGETAAAREAYCRICRADPTRASALAVRVARTLEAEGDLVGALDTLRGARPTAPLGDGIALDRAGRRLARKLRGAWAPAPPLARAPARDVRLEPAETPGPRPGWRAAGQTGHVEAAVRAWLATHRRTAVRGEGPLWRTLYALLLVDDGYFLPVPGALPVPRLPGPLDAGSPSFGARRPEAAARAIQRAVEGAAPEWIAAAWDRHHGTRLAGCSWRQADRDQLVAVAQALGPTALACVVEHLLRAGWRASRGLPDLVVLPGPPLKLPDSFPAPLTAESLLVEVKGPGDALRDDQAAWHHRLLSAGAQVEVWQVRPTPVATRMTR